MAIIKVVKEVNVNIGDVIHIKANNEIKRFLVSANSSYYFIINLNNGKIIKANHSLQDLLDEIIKCYHVVDITNIVEELTK